MASETEQSLDQTFEMGSNSELSVSNVSGHIRVRADEESRIVIKSMKRGSGRSRENTQVDIHRDGNKVSVQTRSATAGLINFGRSSSVDYDVVVPRDCTLRVHAVSADVEVSGSRADVGIQTVSGDVVVRDLAGDITVTTITGDIQGDSVSGTLVARTTSGDSHMLKSRLRRFSTNTVSGDFTIQTPLISDEHSQAKSVSGDLVLLVPSDTAATVQLKSVSGSVSCDLPAEVIKSGRRHWQGRINGGGSHVEMHSVSGDLRIRKAASGDVSSQHESGSRHGTDWSPTPPTPLEPLVVPEIDVGSIMQSIHSAIGAEIDSTSPVGTTKERTSETSPTTEILGALERGELSVEEAMTKLEAAGAS